MAQAILKLTHQEAAIKVWPSDTDEEGSNIIALADLVAAGQEVDTDVDQVVNIVGIAWMGAPEAVITISRDDETIMSLPCTGASTMDFTGQNMPPDSINNTDDLDITFEGVGQLYIKLRKVSGYLQQIEDATYGSYDDPTRVGASTTLSGSPDKE